MPDDVNLGDLVFRLTISVVIGMSMVAIPWVMICLGRIANALEKR